MVMQKKSMIREFNNIVIIVFAITTLFLKNKKIFIPNGIERILKIIRKRKTKYILALHEIFETSKIM